MIWPPSLLGIRIGKVDGGFRLWLPLFLIWPPILLMALVLFPFVLLLSMLLWPAGWGRTMLLTGPRLFRLFCALRGLVIDVKNGTNQVYIVFR